MKKKQVIVISLLGVIVLVIGIVILCINKVVFSKSKIQIIDATYSCAQSLEKFYEDDKYIYYFPCVQSGSVYVKFENGNKMLVVDALEEEKVTIEELLDAGLEVRKQEK
jgi:hypothetical protein